MGVGAVWEDVGLAGGPGGGDPGPPPGMGGVDPVSAETNNADLSVNQAPCRPDITGAATTKFV